MDNTLVQRLKDEIDRILPDVAEINDPEIVDI